MPVVSKKKSKAVASSRPIVHPEFRLTKCLGDQALTAQKAKDLLGWEEVETSDPSCSPEIHALAGVHVRLTKNIQNQPLYTGHLEMLKQELLQRRWQLNAATIAVGKTDVLLDGQHRLIALILAENERQDPERAAHWATNWPGPVTMETLVAYGLEENDALRRVMNRGRQSTSADALYRSDWFAHLPPDERKIQSRMADYAVKLLWDRTGAKSDPYAPDRTPAETLDFVERHSRLLKSVQHVAKILDENGRDLARYLPAGGASGLIYLLGCSGSDGDKYRASDPHGEKGLDWRLWDRACEYITDIVTGQPTVAEVRNARRPVEGQKQGESNLGRVFPKERGAEGGSFSERLAVLLRGWNTYRDGKNPTEAGVRLEYDLEWAGDKTLASAVLTDRPLVGGIDWVRADEEDEEPEETADESTPEEVEERKAEVRREKAQKIMDKRAESKSAEPRSLADEIDDIRTDHPGKILAFRSASGYTFWGLDANRVAQLLKLSVRTQSGLPKLEIPEVKFQDAIAKVAEAGNRVAICEPSENGSPTVSDHVAPKTAPAKSKGK